MEVTTYKEKLNIKERGYTRYHEALNDFMATDDKSMMLTFGNNNEAFKANNAIRQYVRVHDMNVCIYKDKNKVYVIKG